MRAIVLALAFTACGGSSNDGSLCNVDAECSPDVCARNGECEQLANIRSVHITWTISGMPASATLCANMPDLELDFAGPDFNDSFGFAPVPCMAGQFTIDKLPRRFTQVDLGLQGGPTDSTVIDGNDTATFDLMF